MNKREQSRKMGECTCSNCGILFKKPQSEINRNLKIGRRNFCTRSCSGVGNAKNFGDQKNNYDISKHSANSRDEFTPFRYHFRNCKKRYRDFNIDLQYLKELWEQQQGVCPFSGIKLVLNAYTNIFKDQRYSASLDRIDSNKGYVKGNVRWVSRSINLLKNDMTDDQLIEFLNIISDRYKK
jgi:hypothetical protein